MDRPLLPPVNTSCPCRKPPQWQTDGVQNAGHQEGYQGRHRLRLLRWVCHCGRLAHQRQQSSHHGLQRLQNPGPKARRGPHQGRTGWSWFSTAGTVRLSNTRVSCRPPSGSLEGERSQSPLFTCQAGIQFSPAPSLQPNPAPRSAPPSTPPRERSEQNTKKPSLTPTTGPTPPHHQ